MAIGRNDSSSEAHGPPPGLGRRPRAVTYSIEDLMELVQDGKVRIPRFQRALRWEGDDARSLLDSIARGYPIGTLLFWKRPGEAGAVTIGALRFQSRSAPDALWVVDGQQRITSLANALIAPQKDAGPFAIVYDLDTGEFLHPRSPGISGRTLLPLTAVLNSSRLLEWLFERGSSLSAEQRNRALEVGKSIREYQVPAYQVESEDEDALRNIFKRLNSSGKTMFEHEVFDALHGARGSIPGSLRGIADDIAGSGFGRPDEKFLLRSVKAIEGVDITKEFTGESASAELLARTTRAIREVVAFLQRDGKIGRFELLPYKLPIATLSRFFDLHPTPSTRSRDLLARWIWRGAVSGRHSGDTIGTRKVLDAITDDEEGSVQRLLEQAGPPENLNWATPFNFRHATSKLESLALLDLGPRNLETSEPITLGEMFPDDNAQDLRFEKVIDSDQGLSRTVANRIAHPVLHGRLREHILAVKDVDTLRSHGIDQDGAAALRKGNWNEFLERRSELLHRHTTAFLAKRTRWGETDRPSLSALRIAD